jgi:FKBP-type peptidyl-prolyl cis-trans isomerase FklB
MRNVAIILSVLFLSIGVCCSGGGTSALKDQKERESYSLGYQFGKNLKFQETEIDFDVYMAGLRDALEDREARMSQEEIRTTINNLQKRLAEAQQNFQKEQAEKNLAEGLAFLEENGEKEGVITLESGLQYKVLTEGSGESPQKSDTVTVHYKGTLINGTEFDSSYSRGQPQSFRVDGVIPGWTEALQLMKEGAKWQLFIPSALAYAERGVPQRIPPNSTLIFEIELISIQ